MVTTATRPLGNGGDGERDGYHKGVRIAGDSLWGILPTDDANAKDHDADDHHHDGEDFAQLSASPATAFARPWPGRAPAILPISVFMPVPMTTAAPRPYTTVEPM